MDAIECIKTRMSIRKFKPDPVPKDIIIELVDTAKWSPSYKNSQPWEIMVISGAKKDELSNMLIALLEKGSEICPDIPAPEKWPPEIAERISTHMKKRAEATGVDISNPETMKKAKIANFRFYGAPHAIYLFQDASLSSWSIFDLGLFAQSLMLAANAHSLGTVPQAFATDYAKDIKKFLDIPESKRLVLGMSLGYPDLTDRANSYRSERIDTVDITKWAE